MPYISHLLLLEKLLDNPEVTHCHGPHTQVVQRDGFLCGALCSNATAGAVCCVASAGPELPLLQQLGRLPVNVPSPEAASSSLPPGWRVWHDPLQLFACINPPFISATSHMNPQVRYHGARWRQVDSAVCAVQ